MPVPGISMVTGHRAALGSSDTSFKKQDPEKTGTQTGVLSSRSTKGNLSQEMLQHAQDTGTLSPLKPIWLCGHLQSSHPSLVAPSWAVPSQ